MLIVQVEEVVECCCYFANVHYYSMTFHCLSKDTFHFVANFAFAVVAVDLSTISLMMAKILNYFLIIIKEFNNYRIALIKFTCLLCADVSRNI